MGLKVAECTRCEKTRKCKELRSGPWWNRKVVGMICLWCDFNEKIDDKLNSSSEEEKILFV